MLCRRRKVKKNWLDMKMGELSLELKVSKSIIGDRIKKMMMNMESMAFLRGESISKWAIFLVFDHVELCFSSIFL